jgi:pimeloyl-ACP methyl ester carboxylesterase
MDRGERKTTITPHHVASPARSLAARVIRPADLSGLPPLVVLHGISRNADELVDLFLPEAERSGRVVIVPHFSEKRWRHFQRPCRAARPDHALLALLMHLAVIDPVLATRVDLFGHSGGAQLAHRFAMLYPHKVERLHLAAAGWYCLPDTSMAYPYGLGHPATPESASWTRRYDQVLHAYLRLSVRVYVGTADDQRDKALRQTPDLDRIQGHTRIARAETYVNSFRAAAQVRGIVPAITLTRLPDVGHDVGQAIRRGDLAARVTRDTMPCLAAAS